MPASPQVAAALLVEKALTEAIAKMEAAGPPAAAPAGEFGDIGNPSNVNALSLWQADLANAKAILAGVTNAISTGNTAKLVAVYDAVKALVLTSPLSTIAKAVGIVV